VSAIAPPVHPGAGGGATHAVFSTPSVQEQSTQDGKVVAVASQGHPVVAWHPLFVLSKQVGNAAAVTSQFAFSHPFITFLQALLVLSKQVGKAVALASQLAFSHPFRTALHPLFVLSSHAPVA